MSSPPRASQILLVGRKIRQIRKSRHLTQADLAARIGVTQSDLSRMENGEYKVGLDTLFKILQVFELSMSSFFEETPVRQAADQGDERGDEPAEGPARSAVEEESVARGTLFEERRQLLADWTDLPEESRREILDFIAFKKLQGRNPVRKSELPPSDEPH